MARASRLSTSAGWAFLAFAALTLVSGWPLLTRFSAALPSDLGDPALNTWILWWNAHAVPMTDAWWNAPMFAPAPNAFALSESLLALTPLTTPLIRAGASPVAAYNVVYLLAGPLSALGAYLLAWRLTHRRSAACLAALAFGFSPYRIAQLPHLQMEWACGLPLALYCLHAFIESSQRRWLVGFGACWLMTGLSNGYFLIFFPVLLALWGVWFVRERRHLIGIVSALIAASLPMLPILLAYRTRQHAFGLARGIGEIETFSADITALWAASPRLWLSSLWTTRPAAESELYPGIAVLALAIAGALALWRSDLWRSAAETPARATIRRWLIGITALSATLSAVVAVTGGWDLTLGPIVWTAHKVSRSLTIAFWAAIAAGLTSNAVRLAWRRRSPLAFYLLGAVVMFVMALGPSAKAFGTTVLYKAPYSWLMALPGGDALRVPARFAELMILCLSVAGALTWARLVTPGRRALTALAAAAILCEGWMIVPVAAVPTALELPPMPADAAIVELPMGDGYAPQTRALLRGVAHGHPLVNGFSGYDPPHFAALRHGLNTGDPAVIDWLRTVAPLAVFIDADADMDGAARARIAATPGATPLAAVSAGTWFLFTHTAAAASPTTDPPLAGVTATSTTHAATVGAMFDSRLNTRWQSDDPQREDTSLVVHLDHAATITAIEMQLGIWFRDFPLDLEITATGDDGTTRAIWRGRTNVMKMDAALRDPKVVPMVIRFAEPVVSRTLTLRLAATDPKRVWSVAELRVFGR